MRLVHALLLPLVILALLACGCRKSDETAGMAAAIQTIVDGKAPAPVPPAVWTDVREFYKQRAGKTAWVDAKHPSDRATAALTVIRTAHDHGFDPTDYGEADVLQRHAHLAKADKDAPDRLQQLAAFETSVTTALLAFGRDVAIGRTRPETISRTWKARREAPDLAGTLARASDGDLQKWVDEIRPPHPEYAALQKALADLRGQHEKGGWPKVPGGSLKPGTSSPAVAVLRQRLIAGGHLPADGGAAGSTTYDASVEQAVRSFQDLHAIKATGAVDAATLAAMNVPIDHRLQQVALNLQRWRWMPNDLGAQHLLVNIPYYHLVAREHGKPVMDIRVVVGKPGNETPVFSDEMETVVFSPYWNIPDSIKLGETAPAVARDAGYLARNNIEILRVSKGGAQRVDPASVNWGDAGELRQLAFRQRPGASNALGHVKFLFPNDFDVYLHDTPADSLFERPGRAFSHGCVRVEEPEKLANYILRHDAEWTGPRILTAMHSGDERHVKLDKTVPVHIVYFTTWVDDKGGLHFQPDIYGYDERQSTGGKGRPAAISGQVSG